MHDLQFFGHCQRQIHSRIIEADLPASGVRRREHADDAKLLLARNNRKAHGLFIRADRLIGCVRSGLLGRRRKRLPLREPQRNFLAEQGSGRLALVQQALRQIALHDGFFRIRAGKEIAGHAVESSAGLRRGRHSRHHHKLAVRFVPRLGGKSHFGIHFHHIGQGGDFLSRRVVERARGRKIRGIARRAPSAAGLAEGSTLPRPHGNRVEQSGARHRAIHQLLQAHAERQQRHQRSHSDGDAERRERISKDGFAQISRGQFGQVPDFHRRRSSLRDRAIRERDDPVGVSFRQRSFVRHHDDGSPGPDGGR